MGTTAPLDTLKRVLFHETGYHKTLLETRDSYRRRYDSEHMTKGPVVSWSPQKLSAYKEAEKPLEGRADV